MTMRRYLPFILLVLILTSCKSEFGSFNEDVLTFANNDKQIDEKEYQKMSKAHNPYGDGFACSRIIKSLVDMDC